MKDSLGDRMKEQYEDRTRYLLPRRTYTMMRLDGKAFHTYTHGLERPFDVKLTEAMNQTAVLLCHNIQGARFAYVQSDEITILLTDFEKETTSAWFDGNLQKMVSISASMATLYFGDLRRQQGFPGGGPMFDSRIWTMSDAIEVENCFIWRQQDAVRNSISMAAQSVYSHRELHGKSTSDMHEILQLKGINWNDYPVRFKRGGFVNKNTYIPPATEGLPSLTMRSKWECIDPPVFTKDRKFLRSRIPLLPIPVVGWED
jgi:tRNA(His) guanylyltransferase